MRSLLLSCVAICGCAGGKAIFRETDRTEYLIMGKGVCSGQQLLSFLQDSHRGIDPAWATSIVDAYIAESSKEGVNHDIAFAQMCLESGFLRFDGVMRPEQNNFAGLGAVSSNVAGEIYPSIEIGVRAHIQHLKAYASRRPLNEELVDSRFHYVRRGIAPTIFELSRRWGSDPQYGGKIARLLERMYESH